VNRVAVESRAMVAWVGPVVHGERVPTAAAVGQVAVCAEEI